MQKSFCKQENIDTNICLSISKRHTPKMSITEKTVKVSPSGSGVGGRGWREHLCPGASTSFCIPTGSYAPATTQNFGAKS